MTDLITVTEAASDLGVSDRTVWALIKDGSLVPDEAMKAYRRTLLDPVAVEALRKRREGKKEGSDAGGS